MNIAQLESNLKNKDLSVFKTEPIKLIAKQIVQYQKYNFGAAKKKINRMNISESTLHSYFNSGITYITKGIKYKTASKKLYENIDYWLAQKLQPLTPAKGEERKTGVYKKTQEVTSELEEKLNEYDEKQENIVQHEEVSNEEVPKQNYKNEILELFEQELAIGYKIRKLLLEQAFEGLK